MRAAVYRRFGGPEVVRVEDVPKPEPGPGELLIRVRSSTVSIADHRMRARDLPKGLGIFVPIALGVFAPRRKVLGMDAAGTVESVGSGVSRFAPGDDVIAMLGKSFGGHAEYVCIAEDDAVVRKPQSLDFDEAVALAFGGQTAAEFLGRITIKPGDEVLVNGASGAVGSLAVQLAHHAGARVTGVCSARNADLVRSLGADEVIDYDVEDFAAREAAWDAIVECVGNAPFSRVERSLRAGGALLLVIADLRSLLGARRATRRSGKLVTAADYPCTAENLERVTRLADTGDVRPVIDRTYDLDDVVEAHRYVDTGRKRGNVVLRIASS